MTDPTKPLVSWRLPTDIAKQIADRGLWVTEDTPEMFELAAAFDAGGDRLRSEVEGDD